MFNFKESCHRSFEKVEDYLGKFEVLSKNFELISTNPRISGIHHRKLRNFIHNFHVFNRKSNNLDQISSFFEWNEFSSMNYDDKRQFSLLIFCIVVVSL